MGMYKYIREAWKRPHDNREVWNSHLIQWRKEPVTLRIARPTRLDRARSLGYRAKPGIIVVRQRVGRGTHAKPRPVGGRRPKRAKQFKDLKLSYQTIAERRVSKTYVNCEVLNSYWVGEDGQHKWYEVIIVDRSHPAIKSDPQLKWMTDVRGRVERGLTGSARSSNFRKS